MVKIIFISMIKNEEKIIDRCIKGVLSICDAICVNDTGSTDSTIEKVKEIFSNIKVPSKLCQDEWKNFGHNRSLSFNNTRKFCEELSWDVNTTYGLLLDGDMVLQVTNFNKETLTENGYKMIQKNSAIEYYNTRLVKLGHNWKCVGVTHEYWDGSETATITKDQIIIHDIGDGGCKSDKFERDIRLLTEGLKDDPNNGRYAFYLGQSLKDVGRFKDSIKMYKRRIEIGGWQEEVWYSYYMIAKNWLLLKNEEKFECWANKAYKFRRQRAEPIYELTKYFREVGQQIKAYHYYLIGRSIPYPKDDMLFIENHIYDKYLFEYESTILHFYLYLTERVEGMKKSINYLNNFNHNEDNVYMNIDHYMYRMGDAGEIVNLPVENFGDYISTSTSLIKYNNQIYANVRYVNYRIQQDGSYLMSRNGELHREEPVRTKNALLKLDDNMEPESNLMFIKEEVNDLLRKQTHILGLEDIRLFEVNGKIKCIATSREYTINDTNSMVIADYDHINYTITNLDIIMPPIKDANECQKNWIPIENKIIYKWHPLQIGVIKNSKLFLIHSQDTPTIFKHFRGSSNTVKYNNQYWMVVHGVKYYQPRKYYHVIVVLDETYKLVKYSIPFYFDKFMIEYCLGMLIHNNYIYMTASRNDKDPILVKVNLKDINKLWM